MSQTGFKFVTPIFRFKTCRAMLDVGPCFLKNVRPTDFFRCNHMQQKDCQYNIHLYDF